MQEDEGSKKEAGDEMNQAAALASAKAQSAQPEEMEILKRHLEEEKRKAQDHLTRLKYLQADFDNYRKRIDREVQELEAFSTSQLVRRLLPVLDELELAVRSAESSKSSILEGVRMVHKNLSSALEVEGLKQIEALGKPFNPKVHEAVDKVQGKDVGEDMVVEEIRKGFMFKEKMLRPSLVKVRLSAKRDVGEEKEAE